MKLLVSSQSELPAKIYWNSDSYFLHKSTFFSESVSFSLVYFVKIFTSCLHFIPKFLISAITLFSWCHHTQIPGQDFGGTLCDIHCIKQTAALLEHLLCTTSWCHGHNIAITHWIIIEVFLWESERWKLILHFCRQISLQSILVSYFCQNNDLWNRIASKSISL